MVACGPSAEEKQALVDETVLALNKLEGLQAELADAELVYTEALDEVETGPGMVLNIWLDLADRQEYEHGWTVQADQTRREAWAEFNDHPLARELAEAEWLVGTLRSETERAADAFIAASNAVDEAGAEDMLRRALAAR